MLKRRIAAALMTLMGLLWGWHGIALLVVGDAAMLDIVATATTLTATAGLYLLVAVTLLVAAVATVRQRRHAFALGVISALTFVISGFIANGMLFDTSRLPHNVANVVLTLAVVWLLLSARSET